MSHIHSVVSGVPNYSLSQLEFYLNVAPKTPPRLHKIFKRILDGSEIRKRHFSFPIEEMIRFTEEKRVEDKFKLWNEVSTEFFTDQARKLIEEAGLEPSEIDGICTSTTSGFMTPHVDIMVQHKLKLKPDIMRMPLFALGCSGGMAAINRVKEHLDGAPHKAFLVCVGETLSTQYENAKEVAVLVSNSIFSDGFGTLLMVGREHRLAKSSQVELLNSKSYLFPKSNFAIGQWMTDEGLHSHVDAKLPKLLREQVMNPLNSMFAEMALSQDDVKYWVMHAGGPKVVEALGDSLGISDEKLELTLETYRNYGNQGSVSIITALDNALKTYKKPGLTFMSGIGPGVHMEYCLCKLTPKLHPSSSDGIDKKVLRGNLITKNEQVVEIS